MIYNTSITPVLAPVDKASISTSFRIAEVLGTCLPECLHTLPPLLREVVRSITMGAKNKVRFRPKDAKMPPKYDPKIPTRQIHVDGFDTITLRVTKDPLPVVDTIIFNPGKLIYGHNGRILTVDELLLALSILNHLLTPLLADPGDWIHIVPGLHDNSRASWKSLEIPVHVLDEDGSILKAFANAKHLDMNLPPFFKRKGQSVTFANSTNTLLIRAYRKDIELGVTKRGKVSNAPPVLRLEVALEDDKLHEYFGGGTWKPVDGIRRLVSFRPSDLRQPWLDVMTKFQGCYSRVPAVAEKDNKLGRHMGWVTSKTGLSFHDQFDNVKQYYDFENAKAESNTKSRLYAAARAVTSLLSPVQLADLFSEQAWNNQPNITMQKLEAMTLARHKFIDVDPLVAAAYGSKPQPTPSNP